MPQLDNYLVTLGMKGQNLVLSQMDKIRKSGKDLSKKKTVVDLVAKTGKRPSVVTPEKTIEQSEGTQEPTASDTRALALARSFAFFGGNSVLCLNPNQRHLGGNSVALIGRPGHKSSCVRVAPSWIQICSVRSPRTVSGARK